jgi:mRNA interferase YafQ
MNNDEKYQVAWTTRFKKDYKLAKKRGFDVGLLESVVHLLATGTHSDIFNK